MARSCPLDLEVLIERPFATRRSVSVGDTLAVSRLPDSPGCPAVVVGIFEPPPDPSRLVVERPRFIFHLPQLAGLLDRPAEVDRYSVALRDGQDPGAVASSLNQRLAGAQALPTAQVTARSSTTFQVVSRFHEAIGAITLVAGGAFLACIMILKVQERRTQVAALRLIGISKRTLGAWIVAETTVVSLVGGAAGFGLGQLASWIINGYYQAAYDTTLVFSLITPIIVVKALFLAIVLGLVAGLLAALRLFRVQPLVEAGR
jgi:putative ABC transport system permease protein